MLFLFNLIWSLKNGKEAGGNPWRATTLEWFTPDTPPRHGNWGAELPVVYRWAYEYGVPGLKDDFVPQNQPPAGGESPEFHGHGHGYGPGHGKGHEHAPGHEKGGHRA
jgi:cytochrome c oxidase subunit 1